MLVEQPHNLGGIHRGAAANRDDRVRLELLAHHLSALFDGLDGGLRLDVVDDAEGHTVRAGAQLVDDLVDNAELLMTLSHTMTAFSMPYMSRRYLMAFGSK